MASYHRRAVGIFSDRPRTASALQALNDAGFAMHQVSVIARDADRQTAIAGINVHNEVSNQANTGGTAGAVVGGVLGGVTGLLVGLGTLTIPGLGPALLAGEAATALAALVGGAAGMEPELRQAIAQIKPQERDDVAHDLLKGTSKNTNLIENGNEITMVLSAENSQ